MVYRAYRASSVRTNALKGTQGVRRRRFVRKKPDMAKIRYQAPTARNQRSQIMANARFIAKHCNQIRKHRVWTDWQNMNEAVFTTGEWNSFRLTDFSTWNPVLRQDPGVNRIQSHTFVDRLVINMRVSLYAAQSSVVSVFIVSPRKSFANRDPVILPPELTAEYIYPVNNPGYNVRINSNVWKVHAVKYMTLTTNGLDNPPGGGTPEIAGNPFTTYRKWQVTIPCKFGVTCPIQPSVGVDTWKDTAFDMLPYYNRYFIMVYNQTVQGTGSADSPFFTFDSLATCINSD